MPYKSRAQQRKFFAMEAEGEIPKGMAERWAHHTKDIKSLPEHASDTEKKADGPSYSPGGGYDGPNGRNPLASLFRSLAGAGIIGAGVGAVGGGIAGHARGDTSGGIGRGIVRGGATGVGASLGSGLGGLAGMIAGHHLGNPNLGLGLGGLGGAGLGGLAAYLTTGQMLGKPRSLHEKEKQGAVMDNVNLLAQRAGEIPYVEKLAADA